MRWSSNQAGQFLLAAAAIAPVANAGRSLRHVGRSDDLLNVFQDRSPAFSYMAEDVGSAMHKRASAPQFLNSNTSRTL